MRLGNVLNHTQMARRREQTCPTEQISERERNFQGKLVPDSGKRVGSNKKPPRPKKKKKFA